MPRFYLTTAIDYANGDPHLGHALEKIGADVIARYRRQCGDDVHLLIGMDEHGQKVQQTAAKDGVAPQAFTDEIAARFQAIWAKLGISYDQFIRTTEPHHKAGVQALIRMIAERNPDDFYERSYTGMYCVGCEAFKQDADIVALLYRQNADGSLGAVVDVEGPVTVTGAADRFYSSRLVLRHCYNQDDFNENMRDGYREHTIDLIMRGLLV